MLDLWTGILVVLALAAAVFTALVRAGRAWSRRRRLVVAAGAVIAVGLYGWLVLDEVWLIRVLPWSNVMVLSDLLILGVAVIAAMAWLAIPGPLGRKLLSVVPLCGVGAYTLLAPLLAPSPGPLGRDRWKDGVCMQTSEVTCSAACAATLLHNSGIPATEEEMVRLCLTSYRGTETLGLYRGLVLKARAAGRDVRVIVGGDLATLREAVKAGPLVLTVGLPLGGADDPRFERDWGWTPGKRHAVILFGFTGDGTVDMGDPSVGREPWREEDLRVLYRGEAMAIR